MLVMEVVLLPADCKKGKLPHVKVMGELPQCHLIEDLQFIAVDLVCST